MWSVHVEDRLDRASGRIGTCHSVRIPCAQSPEGVRLKFFSRFPSLEPPICSLTERPYGTSVNAVGRGTRHHGTAAQIPPAVRRLFLHLGVAGGCITSHVFQLGNTAGPLARFHTSEFSSGSGDVHRRVTPIVHFLSGPSGHLGPPPLSYLLLAMSPALPWKVLPSHLGPIALPFLPSSNRMRRSGRQCIAQTWEIHADIVGSQPDRSIYISRVSPAAVVAFALPFPSLHTTSFFIAELTFRPTTLASLTPVARLKVSSPPRQSGALPYSCSGLSLHILDPTASIVSISPHYPLPR